MVLELSALLRIKLHPTAVKVDPHIGPEPWSILSPRGILKRPQRLL